MRRDIAVRGHDVAVKDDLDGLGDALQRRGIHSLAFAPSQTLPVTTDNGEDVSVGLGNYTRRALADHDVEIATLSCYVNMIHPDKAVQETMIARLARYLQIAPAFGTRIVATETGSVNPHFFFTEENYTQGPFNRLVNNVKRLLPVAWGAGTFLALEPGVNHPLYSLKRTSELIDAVGEDSNLKLIVDPANLSRKGTGTVDQILTEAFERFGSRIVAVHLKDFVWTPAAKVLIKTVVPGTGIVNVQGEFTLADRLQPFGIKCLDELPNGMLDQTLSQSWLK